MKKVVLIDDNSLNHRELYGASFVDNGEYDDCMMHIEKLNRGSDFSFVLDAACLMMHRTLEDYEEGGFKSDSHKAKERIENILEDADIPTVTFSDGDVIDWREEEPNVVYAIKKSEFYLHLKPFLDEYRRSGGKIDMRIIAFGNNYMVHMMRLWYESIIKKMVNYNDEDILTEDMFDRRALRLFLENADLGEGITIDYIMHKIEDDEYTVKDLKDRINNIISSVIRYGKNISSWE